jgi:hypothetical protein
LPKILEAKLSFHTLIPKNRAGMTGKWLGALTINTKTSTIPADETIVR